MKTFMLLPLSKGHETRPQLLSFEENVMYIQKNVDFQITTKIVLFIFILII